MIPAVAQRPRAAGLEIQVELGDRGSTVRTGGGIGSGTIVLMSNTDHTIELELRSL